MASDPVNLQDPGETQSWSVDFTAQLVGAEAISSNAWSVTPTGPAISADVIADAVASCDLAGVVLGGIYRLTNTAVTSAGRTLVASVIVRGFPL